LIALKSSVRFFVGVLVGSLVGSFVDLFVGDFVAPMVGAFERPNCWWWIVGRGDREK
jgi:uncharacterized protein YqgC (DUF456 family)